MASCSRRILPCLGIAIAALVVALRTPALARAVGPAAEDPVTGVWKGLARGDGTAVPRNGVPASLWLEREEADRVRGRVFVQGFDAQDVSGSFDADAEALTLKGLFRGVPFQIDVTVRKDTLLGRMWTIGMSVDLQARRISREVLAEPPAPDRPTDLAQLTPADWTEDLRFLAGYLPQVHANAFHARPAEAWRRDVAALEKRLPELDGLQIAVALAQLVAGVGDAHTELAWRELPGFGAFPIRFAVFADGLFVTEVDERWTDAIGGRVLRVGERPASEALAAVASVFAAENDAWRDAKAPGLLTIPRLLAALGVTESPDRLPLVIEEPGGEELALVVEAQGDGSWLRIPDPAFDTLPLWQTRRGEGYWYTVLIDDSTVYCAYNRCAEDPRQPLKAFVTSLLEAVDISAAERLVIDLRNNSGGDSSVLSRHLERLAQHPILAGPGGLVALIGPGTYSSGMMNAHQLREVGATLVGTPTGGKPNSYGEMRSFRLPRSGLKVFYSTKYFRMLDDDPPAVEPDVLVETTSDDHFAGEDPVLRRALSIAPAAKPR